MFLVKIQEFFFNKKKCRHFLETLMEFNQMAGQSKKILMSS